MPSHLPTILDRAALLSWFDAHRRDLPWRLTRDPYSVWVSEIMLQQTQVATVQPYYVRWMERFPTVEALAAAGEQDVLSIWQGLGYYRRCRMLLEGARWVVEHGIPDEVSGWMRVPGVGRYTAGAIVSIAYGKPVPLVDGNVERVFARLEGCELSGPALSREAWVWAAKNVDSARPGDWNQALMELGATVCRPREPLCGSCPLAPDCVAQLKGIQAELPRAGVRIEPKRLEREAWIYERLSRFGLEQIPPGEWWEGMWRFPNTARHASSSGGGNAIGTVKHVVTRHRITMCVHLVRTEEPESGLTWFSPMDLKTLPMPAPQRRALELAVNRMNSLLDFE